MLATFLVDTLADESDGSFLPGDFSLREAIERANLTPAADEIDFQAGLTGFIQLRGSELLITEPLAIRGPGADQITVSAGGSESSRVFHVANAGDVTIARLTISSGHALEGGGVRVENANLILSGAHLRYNSTEEDGAGAGIYSSNARLTVVNSTIADNWGTLGAGIFHSGVGVGDPADPTLLVINSTISGNQAVATGGGVYVYRGASEFRNCTITGNRADRTGDHDKKGGGIFTERGSEAGASTMLKNTIVIGNRNRSGFGDLDGKGAEANSAYNLIGHQTTEAQIKDGVNGNILASRNPPVYLDSELRFNGGATPTHLLTSGSRAIDAGNNALALGPFGGPLGGDSRGRPRFADRFDVGVATVDIGAVEMQPLDLRMRPTVAFSENGARVFLGSGATVVADAPWSLTVGLPAATYEEVLAVHNEGSGLNQLRVVGDDIWMNNRRFAGQSGGVGTQPLVIKFVPFATSAFVQAVVRNLTYDSESENPPRARSVALGLRAASGAVDRAAVTVDITPVNDPPEISSPSGSVGYIENNPPVLLARDGYVYDVDSPHFAGGRLVAQINAGAQASDRLVIQRTDDVATVGNQVFFAGELIGTFGGGAGSSALAVFFNQRASQERVRGVLQSVAFENISENPAAHPRTVTLFVNDGGGGGRSNVLTQRVNLVPVNDAPRLLGIGGSVGYQQGSPAIWLAREAALDDPDSASFYGGKLTVRITSGGHSGNRLLVGGDFSFAGNNVKRNGVVIGVRNAGGGVGNTRLEIMFNANASRAIVQQLLRSLRFGTASGMSTVSRTIAFTLTDGDGGTSDTVTKTVHVTNP